MIEHYINQSHHTIPMTIGGDAGAAYELVVKNCTLSPNRYLDQDGSFQTGYRSFVYQVRENNSIVVDIPAAEEETEYAVYFTKQSQFGALALTDYDESLPTEMYPWYINQLLNVTTTVQVHDGDEIFTGDDDDNVIITTPPEAILGSSKSEGTYNVKIYVDPKPTRLIRLIGDAKTTIIKDEHIDASGSDIYTVTEITKHNLTATCDLETNRGLIEGTITINKTAKKSTSINILASSIFTDDKIETLDK